MDQDHPHPSLMSLMSHVSHVQNMEVTYQKYSVYSGEEVRSLLLCSLICSLQIMERLTVKILFYTFLQSDHRQY